MTITLFDCEQNSPEWYAARLGIPTASAFATVMASGKDGGASVTRKAYMMKLAGEIITGEPMESYENAHMERGKIMEDEARSFYSLIRNVDVARVGFIRNGDTGCSPDGLIGKSGMSEIKTKIPNQLITCILRDDFPPEHRAQCQGSLWVAEREWIDFIAYWPKMPPFIIRAGRDEGYIKTIKSEVARFNDELAELVTKIRNYRPAA
jgi:hypothetical protein